VVPYLTLMTEAAPQREHSLRELFNALRYVIRYGIAWRAMPNDFPPWAAVYQQSQRWLASGCFETLAQDLRAPAAPGFRSTRRADSGHHRQPHPALDARERYPRRLRWRQAQAWVEGAHGRGHAGSFACPARHPGRCRRSSRSRRLAADIQDATGDSVRLAFVDQGYTGETAADAAATERIALHVVKLPEAKRGFVLLPRRWVVERSFTWATRCRRLVKDYERYAETLAGFHVIAFVGYMLV